MNSRPRIVVLGTGFSSFMFLKTIDVKAYDVCVISPRNYFLFTPLLPSTTVGTVEFRSIVEPVRMARRGFRFIQAWCEDVDFTAKKALCRGAFRGSKFEVPYDMLVIGVGAIGSTFGVPGVEKFAHQLKELPDAQAIRSRVIENFERANKPGRTEEEKRTLLHFMVVGGGPTGVEFAAELHDFVTEDLHEIFPEFVDYVKISLVEAHHAILTQFDKKLGDYALDSFKRQKIDLRLNLRVSEVREGPTALEAVLSSGEVVPCGMVVWATGIGPSELAARLNAPKDKHQRLVTDEYLRLKGHAEVFAFGDCAVEEKIERANTAQVAQQEGKYLAGELNRRARGKEMKPFTYRHMGMLAYIGSRRALADVGKIQGKGFAAWLFWRSAYLTKLVSWKNKFLVLVDWTASSLFGRDVSRI